MRRFLAFFVAIIMFSMVLYCPVVSAYMVEFEDFFDDFSNGMTQWTVTNGNSNVVKVSEYKDNQALILKGSEFANTIGVIAGSEWSDVAYQSDFTVTSVSGYYGWYFRYSPDNHYLLQFYPDNQLKLLKKTSLLGSGYTEIASQDISIEAEHTYTIKIVAKGSSITVFLGSVQVLYAEDDDISSGKIGVRSLSQDVYFDNISASVFVDIADENGGSEVLFYDNFDDGVSKNQWSVVNGNLDLDDSIYLTQGTNMLKLTDKDGSSPSVVVSNVGWPDYVFSTDMTLSVSGTAGMMLRYISEKNHYYLKYADGTVTLNKRVNSLTYEKLGEYAYTMSADSVYRVKAELKGSTIKIYINDTEILNLNDTSLAVGKIGLCVQNGTAIFDNVVVYNGNAPYYLSAKTDKIISSVDVSGIKQFYYVAPDGNDNNDGSIEAPFKTITKAKEKISSSGVPDGGVCVYFRAGEYYMPTGEYFYSAKDGGRPGSPVVYSSYPGERAVFTGAITLDTAHTIPISKQIANRLTYPEKVMAIDLEECGVGAIDEMVPSGYSFNPSVANYELYYGEEKLTLARWPNNQYLKTGAIIDRGSRPGFGETENKGFSFEYNENKPAHWENTDDVWMSGAWSREWAYSNIKIDKINVENNTITTIHPSPYGAESGMPYYYYNVLEELDSPGEWYLDRQNKILYVYPPGSLENTSLSLSYTPYAFLRFSTASNMVFQNIDICRTRANGVTINDNVSNVVFQGCRISNTGLAGISITGKNCGFLNGEIVNTGGIGIALGCTVDDRKGLITSGNFCHNSYIENCGKANYSYLANVAGVGNIFTNNVVRDGYSGGIGFGGNENLIAYNEVSEVCKLTNDCGAIYTAGKDFTQRGNRICNNYIHDVNASEASSLSGPAGVYLDAMSSGNFITGNTIVRVTHPMLIGGGRENTITGNVIVDQTQHSKRSFTFDQRGTDPTEYDDQGTVWDRLKDVTKNAYDAMPCGEGVWKSKYPKLATLWEDEPQKPKYNTIAGNCIYNHCNGFIESLVSENGYVEENILLDYTNTFNSYAEDDYNIKSNSSIYTKSERFENTEFYRTGTYNDGTFRTTSKSVSDFYLTYPADVMDIEEQYLAWSISEGADVYYVELAEDIEFNDIIFEESTLNTYIALPNLDKEKTFYWRVTALSRSKSFSDTRITSCIGSFSTATESEVLELSLKKAKEIYNTAINAKPLEFSRADLNTFRALICEIEKLQFQGQDAELNTRLEDGVSAFLSADRMPSISFEDDFSKLADGEIPDGYERAESGVSGSTDSQDEKCLLFNDSQSNGYPVLIKQVDNIFERAQIRFRIKANQLSGGSINIKLRETNGVAYQDPMMISMRNGMIYVDGEELMPYNGNHWYNFVVDMDLVNNTYSLSINDIPKVTEKSFAKVNYLNQLVFTGDISSTGQYYIDNIIIHGNGFFKPIYDRYIADDLCSGECVIRKDGSVLNVSENSVSGVYYFAECEENALLNVFAEDITIPSGGIFLPERFEYTNGKVMFWDNEIRPISASKIVVKQQ